MATYKKKNDNPKIRDRYKPSDEEYADLRMVYDRKTDMEDSPDRQDALKIWDNAEKQWEAHREQKNINSDTEWQSNHYVPLTTGVVEAALAEIIDQSPRPLILPRSTEDQPKAQVMRFIYDYSWEVADGDTELYNIIKDALIYGTAIGQEFYWKDRRLIQNISLDKGKKENYVEHEIFDYDDCYLECVKLQDFFVDEKARGFTGPYGARDCIRRYIMNIDDFKLFFSGDVWDHLDNAKYVEPGGDLEYYEFFKPPQGMDKSKEVEVLWYWSKKPSDKLIICANDVVVRRGPNPYRHKQLPFVRAVDIKRTHKFYGKGEAELLESAQDELNTMRRMMLDRNHLDIDKMFLVSSRLDLSDEDLIARPHGMIPTDDPNGAKAVEYGDVPRSVQLGKEWLQEDALRATGIDDRIQGVQTPSTATEAAILKESTLKRIRMKMRLLERETLVQSARLRVANIIQFYSQPRLEKIVGKKGTEEYLKKIQELKAKGAIEMGEDGQAYEKSYRQIRLEDKQVTSDVKGKTKINSKKGISFFEAKPEMFIPTARGGFDIKFAAGATLPISKPLMQTKTQEMFDRLIQLAINQVGYDPVKLGDALLEVNDYDPEDFHLQQEQAAEDDQAQRLELITELAMRENEMMMKGQPVPSTAYAPPAHTQLHVEFMNSPQFQQLPNNSPIIQAFTDHIVGEIAAQQTRGGAGNTPQQGQGGIMDQFKGNQQPANESAELRETVPALVRGGESGPVGL